MMKRVFGAIATVLGCALILLGIGALIGNSWAESQVKHQLAQERITMPDDKGIAGIEDQGCKDQLNQYKGQELTDGDQAKVFADCYILQHMMKSSNGKTYEEVSGEFMKDKSNKELGDLRQSLFMGDTLRGLLLSAYAWWTFAQIAKWVGIGSLVLGIPALIAGLMMMRRRKHERDDHVVRSTTARRDADGSTAAATPRDTDGEVSPA